MVRTSAVVVAYGECPQLVDCLRAIKQSEPMSPEVIVVDNGTRWDIGPTCRDMGVVLVRPGDNTGFAGGCNIGADTAIGENLVFVNPDAIVAADSIARLTEVLRDNDVGLATGSVRQLKDPKVVNTAGNPLHFLGFSWAGGNGDSVDLHQEARDVAGATGAFFAVRRDVWDQLGGFEKVLFTYHEDADLSLRAWLAGYRVRYVPDAVALHDYEFTRNPRKLYFAERNRWITVLTVYPAALLIAAVPAMVLAELGMLALAARQGWLRAKLSGYAWLISHASWLRRRRANIRRTRSQSAAMLAGILSTRLEPAVVDLPPWIGLVNRALDLYWRLVRLVVPRTCRANQPSQARPDC